MKLRDKGNCDVFLGGTTFAYKDTLPTSTTTAATPVVDRKGKFPFHSTCSYIGGVFLLMKVVVMEEGVVKEEGGLSGGAIAGIIVALIFVVALCVFVFLLIRRRNAGGDKQSGSLPHDANSTDTSGLETGTSHHEHPDIPESSNYYSMPFEEDGTLVGGQPPVVEYSNENSVGATISTVEPGSPYYIVSDRDPSRDYWTSLQPPDQDKNLYLSLGADASSASTSKPGHGGYLEGNTSSTYLTPILDGGKCTEDASVGRTDPYENSSPKEAYVNTKAN
ncbi:hypothetical protein BaRGS_00018630 [Batillaria attramentaria]|uniref:Uncharacterized protein n=1 Tax=Batillaria attramentaria TaxID=370345 RepID=A0ABD0KSY8_9CAEN